MRILQKINNRAAERRGIPERSAAMPHIVRAAIFAFAAAVIFLAPGTASAAAQTNVTSTSKYHWAWNDVVGWIDLYNTGTVYVSSTATTTGYASSSAGYFAFDCATYPNPPLPGEQNICGSSNFGVYNPGNGNLTGWGWNDTYGWISFDCNNNNGCGTSNYKALIDTASGDFGGYAWNDVIGWISFNCDQTRSGQGSATNDCPPPRGSAPASSSDYMVNTTWTSSSTYGYLDSSTFDTGVAGGAELNSIVWQGNLNNASGSTGVKFQIAVSNTPNPASWNFVGYDGSSATYYPQTGFSSPSSSVPLSYTLHNNNRYFRYRVYIYSDAQQKHSPVINGITVNWSP